MSRPSDQPVCTITEHGLIGDLRTAALVGLDGTIDWFCPGRFDAPSVFAAILDAERGGHWRLSPVGEHRVAQFYFPDTNVLVTRFMTRDGVVELQDLMPVSEHQRLIRRVVCVRGQMRLSTELAARFDYARARHRTRRNRDGVVLDTDDLKLTLFAGVALETERGDIHAEIDVTEGETVTFALHVGDVGDRGCHRDDAARSLFDSTVSYWRDWLERSTYVGRWREMVHRSALTLKLLTYAPSGAIVAAPTTGLPEVAGGESNWDYRYVWMRDAAFTVYSLLRLGFTDEAAAFNAWTAARLDARDGSERHGPLQTMYRVDGSTELDEQRLDHLAGHAGSSPVRIGNAAAKQLQLDIYGELIDSIYLYDKYGVPVSFETWEGLTAIVDWLCENWDSSDTGIWESRDGERDHTFSRLMCWVAIERMVRIARKRGLPADIVRWSAVRDDIHRQIMTRGWSSERDAFTGRLDDGVLDASLLLMPMVKFCSGTEPRFISTLAAIENDLVADTLVYRYDPSSSPGDAEGTFDLLVLVRGGADPLRTPGRCPDRTGEDVHLRQPPRPLCRADRRHGRAARQLSPGVHPLLADLGGLQPGSRACGLATTRVHSSFTRRQHPGPTWAPASSYNPSCRSPGALLLGCPASPTPPPPPNLRAPPACRVLTAGSSHWRSHCTSVSSMTSALDIDIDAFDEPAHPPRAGVIAASVAVSVPETAVSNAEIGARLGVDDEWIARRTGIHSRRIARGGERLETHATDCARAALERAEVDPVDVDLVIVATTTSDELMPGTAPLVAHGLGATGAGAFDVGSACTGFLSALAVGAGQIEAGRAQCAVVIGADFFSRITDPLDRSTAAVFADGAGAVVLESTAGEGRIGPVILGADGAGAGHIYAEREDAVIRMRGHETFREAVARLTLCTHQATRAAGVALDDIDLFVYHQANGRILSAVGERLGLASDRVVDCIGQYGNTSAATLPLALAFSEREGMLAPGDRVLLGAFGAGFTWGATVIEWGRP